MAHHSALVNKWLLWEGGALPCSPIFPGHEQRRGCRDGRKNYGDSGSPEGGVRHP